MSRKNTSGVCALTGKHGRFVRCHLIPKAVTRANVRGNFFIQAGQGMRPKIAWDSWYDEHLVTTDGEALLAGYDTWGIEELRRLRLIWQSWDQSTDLASSVRVVPGCPSFGLRVVTCADPKHLRLFFLLNLA